MPDAFTLDPRRTAMVVIDLQAGILARTTAPHTSAEVLERCVALCERFRAVGGHVVLVRVSYSASGADALSQPVDEAMPASARPPGWDVLSPALGNDERDVHITKRQWAKAPRAPVRLEAPRNSDRLAPQLTAKQ